MKYEKISCDACGKEVKPGEKVVESKVYEAPRPAGIGFSYSDIVITMGGPLVREPKMGQFHYTCVSVSDDHNCDQHKCRCCR